MREFMNITKALADETRVRILLALRAQELCVCQITELFGLAQSTMSKHLFLLKQAGLLDSRKEGRWMFYALPGKEAPVAVRHAIQWVQQSLGENPLVMEDARKLQKLLQIDPAELCRKQCQK